MQQTIYASSLNGGNTGQSSGNWHRLSPDTGVREIRLWEFGFEQCPTVDISFLKNPLAFRQRCVKNPPFSRSVTSSKRNPDVCLKHLRSALLKLAPAGRLVAIVAHWLTPHKYPDYFASLPARLIASIFLDGSYYRHHGTTMDTRMLVFDKDRETTANPIIINERQSIDTIGELYWRFSDG